MVVAQILLAALAMHWINMQYQEKELISVRDLEFSWHDAHRQMIDSMLIVKYERSSNDKSVSDSARFSEFSKFQKNAGKLRKMNQNTGIIHKREWIEKRIRDHTLRYKAIDSTSPFFITHSPDTAVLKSAFVKNVETLYPSLKVEWNNEIIEDTTKLLKLTRFTIETKNYMLHAEVEGFYTLILKDILPQALFALILVILTATAFILSYKSLKSQILLNEQRDDFVRNMSHEIRTPVATVKVALEALKNFNRRNEPEVLEEYLSMAVDETNRLERLINRVMAVSNGGDKVVTERKSVELRQFITEFLRSIKPRIEIENASVNAIFPDTSVIIEADILHLHGVIMNLIDNSIKYSAKPAIIDIELQAKENKAILIVSDHGPGIPEAYKSRIFDKFFRVPAGDVHNIKGYGLGLTYAQMVVNQHGGSIKYADNPGGGSRFIVTLPTSETNK